MKPLFLLLTLLVALSGCSVYDAVFRPYRLPTPKTPPEFRRQQKAKALATKNRDKAANVKKPKSADPDAAAADAPDAPAAPKEAAEAGSQQPANSKSTVQYDKAGLMKKPKLLRRRITKPTQPGFHPFRALKNLFKHKPNGKPKSKSEPKSESDAAPADEAAPDAAPAK